MPDLDVADDITGVDPHIEDDVVDEWEVGEDGNGDVIEQAIEEAPVGPTTTINDTVGTTVEGPPATGRPQRVRKRPESFVPSMQGKKYSYAMAAIMEKLYGKTADQAMQFMGHELRQADDHQIKWPEVIGMCMVQLSMKMVDGSNHVQLSLKAADAKFGTVRTKKAALAEVKQIHMRNTFVPKHWSELTPKQKEQVLEAFMFLEQKTSGKDKGRLVIKGKMQRGHITKEEASSPTASTDAILLTSVIDAL